MAKNEIEIGFPIRNLQLKHLAEVRITIKSDEDPDLIVELSRKLLKAAGEVQNQLQAVRSIPMSSSSS